MAIGNIWFHAWIDIVFIRLYAQQGVGANFDSACRTNIKEYVHGEGSFLNQQVLNEGSLKSGLEDFMDENKFEEALENATQLCSDKYPDKPEYTNSDKVCFSLSYIDIDIKYTNLTTYKPLSAAIGAAKVEVLFDVEVIRFAWPIPDKVKVKATGEIYDTYDFNMGKLTGYIYDYNSDGSWIQHGFIDGVRNAGQVFINSVPFTIELEK